MGMKTLFLHETPTVSRAMIIAHAAAELRAGRLVVFPTETVYGLGANIFNERAVQRIFRAKNRPQDNPLIVHVAEAAQATALMDTVPPWFDELVEEFWPGPLTLVVRRNAAVLDVVSAGLPTVAIRMPAHVMARQLIREAGVPVAAPSANRSGRPSPTTAPEAYEEMRGRADVVLDGGPCSIGIESTVLDLTTKRPIVLRPGVITPEHIEEVVQTRITVARGTSERPAAPGMKYTHYAPDTPVVLVTGPGAHARIAREIARARGKGRRIAVLGPATLRSAGADAFFSLRTGAPIEYARLLYAGLRALDRQDCSVVYVPGIPPEGIGLAVMNRLRKAASHTIRTT